MCISLSSIFYNHLTKDLVWSQTWFCSGILMVLFHVRFHLKWECFLFVLVCLVEVPLSKLLIRFLQQLVSATATKCMCAYGCVGAHVCLCVYVFACDCEHCISVCFSWYDLWRCSARCWPFGGRQRLEFQWIRELWWAVWYGEQTTNTQQGVCVCVCVRACVCLLLCSPNLAIQVSRQSLLRSSEAADR